MNSDLSKIDCQKIALKIRSEIFKPTYDYKTSIFLCGADINNTDMMRYQVAKSLTEPHWYGINYQLIYPEDIFEELLFSSQKKDLLSLEGLLADSVDSIVIIPESPGSFTELGAFANDENLRQKIICLIDEKYKKNKSFINQGPIKLVREANKNGIIYFNPKKIVETRQMLTNSLRHLKKNGRKKINSLTLLQADSFLIPTIYLLEPVSKKTLIDIIGYAMEDEENSFQITTIALSILTKKRIIETTATGYKLTKLGIVSAMSFRRQYSRVKNHDKLIKMDFIRLEILNSKYRNRKLEL